MRKRTNRIRGRSKHGTLDRHPASGTAHRHRSPQIAEVHAVKRLKNRACHILEILWTLYFAAKREGRQILNFQPRVQNDRERPNEMALKAAFGRWATPSCDDRMLMPCMPEAA